MKKPLTFFAVIISLIIFGLSGIFFLIDYDSVYKNFLTNVKIQIGSNAVGPIKINKFPFPHIMIDNVNEEGKIELQNIKINFSLVSLIKLNPQIASLKVGSARINLRSKEWNIVNHENLVAEFLNKGGYEINIEVSNLYLLDETNNPEITIKNLVLLNNGNFKGAVSEIGDFTGSFSRDSEGNKFQLKVVSSNYDVQIDEIYKDLKLVSGRGNGQIKHLNSFLSNNLPDIRSVFDKVSSHEIVNINFDIDSTDQLLALENLVINSPSIEGSGQIYLSKMPKVSSQIKLNFPKIDIDSLIVERQNPTPTLSYSNTGRLVFADKLLQAEIAIDKIKLSATDEISHLKFSGNLEDGKFFIKGITGQIGESGGFALSGEVQQNAYRSLFEGKMSIKHENLNKILSNIGYEEAKVEKVTPFILTSDLKCTVIDFYLQNLLLKTDNLKVNGSLSSKFIGATPRIAANLNFSSLDLSKSDYPIISPLQKFIQGLSYDMKNSDYLSKFIPIRTISYLGNFDITFNELLLKGMTLGKVNLLLNVSPSVVHIDNLYINNGTNYISTTLNLQAKGLKPELDIKISDGILHTNSLNPKSLLSIRNLLLKDLSMDKIIVRVDGALSKLYQGDITFDDVRFKIESDNILFKLSDLQAKVLSGNFKGEGSILLEPFTYNFVYALNSIDLAGFSKLLPRGLYSNEGGASINGMFTTNGDTIEKLLYNLYAKSSIVMKDTKINNFSIDSFIEALTNKDYNPQNLEGDLRSALLTGQNDISSLESDLELTKGVLSFRNTKFQTKYSSASLSATVNIYDFGLNLASVFSFYPADKAQGDINRSVSIVKLNIKAGGSIFEPQKTADSTELLKALTLKKK